MKPIYAVIRKCCLGPRCSHDHPAHGSVKVIQYLTFVKAKADEVAKNWSAYAPQVEEVGDKTAESLEVSSALWLTDKLARPEFIHGYKETKR